MSGHTPGPWEFLIEEGDNKIVAPPCRQLSGRETLICDTQYYPYVNLEDADWRLIAAAPDLLEALEMSLAYILACAHGGISNSDKEFEELAQKAFDKANETIAKATGSGL